MCVCVPKGGGGWAHRRLRLLLLLLHADSHRALRVADAAAHRARQQRQRLEERRRPGGCFATALAPRRRVSCVTTIDKAQQPTITSGQQAISARLRSSAKATDDAARQLANNNSRLVIFSRRVTNSVTIIVERDESQLVTRFSGKITFLKVVSTVSSRQQAERNHA